MNYLIKKMNNVYSSINKMGIWTKVLIISIIILFIVKDYNSRISNKVEAFSSPDNKVEILEGSDIYDEFYAKIYDNLSYSHKKNEYEMWVIDKKTKAGQSAVALDIGSGTGHHVNQLKEIGIENTIGIDSSKDMVKVASQIYPNNKYVLGDAMKRSTFRQNTFSHITMFYFTIYYFKDKSEVFRNCFEWLKPGGFMVVHLVDKEMFDPILPTANPLLMISPQRYAKQRITTSRITFDDFKYDANFELNDENADFIEKFTTRSTGKLFRKNKHHMYMEDMDKIVAMANKVGFITREKVDMVKAEYEYQYLYVFQKPE